MEKLWTEVELAEYLRQSVLTVRRNRTAAPHRHPPFIKIGSSCRYDPVAVRRWLEKQTVNELEGAPPDQAPSPDRPARRRGRPSKASLMEGSR